MNVFSVRAHGNYAKGLAIVAATSMQEALLEASSVNEGIWNIDYQHGDAKLLAGVDFAGEQQVLEHMEYGA